ncbi:MAG TPA: murein biosynthesis integral membrane protein MurJ, partial [Chloroflexia bacterium]|nr:murein biosynthesis integral membrane protein MurJ [Chloroflexia bacterium]
LNARHRFTLAALAPIAYNLAIIGGALFLAAPFGVRGLAYGVVIGAALHFLVQVPGLVRAGMRYQPLHLDIQDEGAAEVARLMPPRIIGQAAFQANLVVMTNIASSLPAGHFAALKYANLLMMLPHGVLAMSMATVLFPTMTAQVGRGDIAAMRATLAGGLRTLLFLTLPAAVLLGLLGRQIVALLFQLGAFKQSSTELVAAPLAAFAWGLVAYAVVEVLTRGFYALQDTRTPVMVSIATVVLNIGLSALLVFQFGMDNVGLALSLALTTSAEMIGLLLFLHRRLPGLFDRATLRAAGISLLAAAAMAAVLVPLVPWLAAHVWAHPDDDLGTKVATGLILAVAGGVGGAVYLGIARLFRAEELGAALRLLRRRSG